MGYAKELGERTTAIWRASNARPSDAVLAQLESASKRGYAWCTVADALLTPDNLRWLSLEGFHLQKLMPKDGSAALWRVTWVRLPKGFDTTHQP